MSPCWPAICPAIAPNSPASEQIAVRSRLQSTPLLSYYRRGDPRVRNDEIVNVRYMVDDVAQAIDCYTKILGFELIQRAGPAFADVKRGSLRLLLARPASSHGRPMRDGSKPGPGGGNLLHFILDDLEAEVAHLRDAGERFRNEIIEGPRQADSSTRSVWQRH